MSELARRVGMSRDGLYKALSEEGNPTWSTILKVTTALGLRFELHTIACDTRITRLRVFGSAVTEYFNPAQSDVDFLVEFLAKFMANVHDLLGDSKSGY